MERNVLINLVDRLKHPLRTNYNLKIDEQSWANLIDKRIAESEARCLPPRFVYRKRWDFSDQGYYLTICRHNPFLVIFSHPHISDGLSNEYSEAIVVQEGQEPRYLFEVDVLDEEDELEWVISPLGNAANDIGYHFHQLSKANLFDSRTTTHPWRGHYPDMKGVLEVLSRDGSF